MKFFVTFMNRQFMLKDKYVVIDAPDEIVARRAMYENFGQTWGFVYPIEQLEQQKRDYGLTELASVTIDEHLNVIKQ